MTIKRENFSILRPCKEKILDSKKYIIGTRGSLLALTQCGQVKDQLEKLTGDKFELKVIKTQGDQITDKPLWQLEGKDFFTKELDEELIAGKIDLVVHSYKDLGSVRPPQIQLAAITKRSFSNDILLIKKETIKDLPNLDEIIVGTSSPRRIVNLEKELKSFLPHVNSATKISTKVLRGNVNSRIQKLLDSQYHAIVLAFPGIERLAITESSRLELEKLCQDLDFMILPHSVFPAAASQGALGIECLATRNDNGELQAKLKLIEDANTVSEVSRERASFNAYGGGCHLAVGINVSKIGNYYIHTHKGKVDDQEIYERKIEGVFENLANKNFAFIGLPQEKIIPNEKFLGCQAIRKVELNCNIDYSKELFMSSNYGMTNLVADKITKPVYTAGTKTWKALSQKGIWVHASTDSLGEDSILNIRNSKFFEMMYGKYKKENISVLTNKESHSEIGNLLAVYERELLPVSNEYIAQLEKCDAFFWTSFSQYQHYLELLPSIKNKFHATGLGKTYLQFAEKNIRVRAFTGIEEFKDWFNN